MEMGTTLMDGLEEIYSTPGAPTISLRVVRVGGRNKEADTSFTTEAVSPGIEAGTSEATDLVLPDIEAPMSTAVLMSDQYDFLTVAGVVDYIGIRRQSPVTSRLPNVPEVSEYPLVWVARGMRGPGHRCIVQSDANGNPVLLNVMPGGNYAESPHPHPLYKLLVSEKYGAIPIFDKPDKGPKTGAWGQ